MCRFAACCVVVALCGVLLRVALCWVVSWLWYVVALGCGMWWCLRFVAWCGVAVCSGVSCLVLVLGGLHGLRQLSCCCVARFSLCAFVVSRVLLCCFVVVLGIVCCRVRVGLVWGYALLCCVVPCHVVWWCVLWRSIVVRCLVVCCVVLYCCLMVGFSGFRSAALFCDMF